MRYKIYSSIKIFLIAGVAMVLGLFMVSSLHAQSPGVVYMSSYSAEDQNPEAPPVEQPESKPTFNIFGFAMLDMIPDFKTNDPDWFDVVRPTKLPAFAGEFGEDGHFYGSVRQTRFGVKSSVPVGNNDLKIVFDFDLFGVGADAGQTTIRLRHAYGELGAFGGGQTESAFMDLDVFPNTVEYWGPNGMVFFRNVQFRWMPIRGDSHLVIALERPGASGDAGDFANRIEIQNIKGRFPLPDLSGNYRYGGKKWGYVQVGGILRSIKWDDTLQDQFDLSGSATGWGINLSSGIKFGKDILHLQYIFGEGVENYMNDAPVDIGIKNNSSNPVTPITGEALGVQGLVIYYDHTWNDRFTSSFGYSRVDIDNSDLQTPDAFKIGEYASGNILFYPAKNVMMGAEFLWGHRENFQDGFTSDDYRVQVSFKYNFDVSIGGK
jgi:DcaP outer membrane protein